MSIRGLVPVDGPVQVKAFVLDPTTLEPFFCDESTSGFSPTQPGTSNFSLSVRQECVDGRSGNIRICWADDQCAALIYQPGIVDVGLLQPDSAATPVPPEGGSGVTDDMIVDATLRVEVIEGRRQEIPRGTMLFTAGTNGICTRTTLPEGFFADLETDLVAHLGEIVITPACTNATGKTAVIGLEFPSGSTASLFTGAFSPGRTTAEFVLHAPVEQPFRPGLTTGEGGSDRVRAPNTGSGPLAEGGPLWLMSTLLLGSAGAALVAVAGLRRLAAVR